MLAYSLRFVCLWFIDRLFYNTGHRQLLAVDALSRFPYLRSAVTTGMCYQTLGLQTCATTHWDYRHMPPHVALSLTLISSILYFIRAIFYSRGSSPCPAAICFSIWSQFLKGPSCCSLFGTLFTDHSYTYPLIQIYRLRVFKLQSRWRQILFSCGTLRNIT